VSVVTPTALLLEAAEVLDGDPRRCRRHRSRCRAGGAGWSRGCPHADARVDAGVATDAVERVVAHLEDRGLRPSELPHERSFTGSRIRSRSSSWVRGTPALLGGEPGGAGRSQSGGFRPHPVLGRGRGPRLQRRCVAAGPPREEIATGVSPPPAMRTRVVRAARRLLNDEAALTAAPSHAGKSQITAQPKQASDGPAKEHPARPLQAAHKPLGLYPEGRVLSLGVEVQQARRGGTLGGPPRGRRTCSRREVLDTRKMLLERGFQLGGAVSIEMRVLADLAVHRAIGGAESLEQKVGRAVDLDRAKRQSFVFGQPTRAARSPVTTFAFPRHTSR
jgi:hypothetical protein